jgi:2-(1,2-epoxy-1,2-dihydrophenyl)acetyl-CoA isomerase
MARMGYGTILVERKERIGRITLNRPEVLNATNDKMGEELHAALKELEKDDTVRCLIITGAGRAFCSGEDIAGFKDRDSIGELLRRKYHPIILTMRHMEKPIIARLNGTAAGGGASLALACDIRIASENASLKLAFIGMGLVPDAGSSYFLTQLLGPGRALELAMTGRTIGATEAATLGLVHKVVPATVLDNTVDELAQQLATGPTRALGLSKRLINEVATQSLLEALESEATLQDIAGRTSDHHKAVEAFLQKRIPKFSGN